MWALITSDGACYFYKEGYVRTSSKMYEEYDPNLPEMDKVFMQLTNNAVQKAGDEYEKFEEGNILSLDTLFSYISTTQFG